MEYEVITSGNPPVVGEKEIKVSFLPDLTWEVTSNESLAVVGNPDAFVSRALVARLVEKGLLSRPVLPEPDAGLVEVIELEISDDLRAGLDARTVADQVARKVESYLNFPEPGGVDGPSGSIFGNEFIDPMPPGEGIVAYPSQDLVDSIGVAVHLVYDGQYYINTSAGKQRFIDALQYLGVNRIRDGWGYNRDGIVKWLIDTVDPAVGGLELAFVGDTRDLGKGQIAGDIVLARSMRDEHIRTGLMPLIKWQEGPNEWDNNVPAAVAWNKHLYNAYRERRECDHVRIGTMSFASLNNKSLYERYGRQDLDVGVSHPYPGNTYYMSKEILDRVEGHFGLIVPGKPVIQTETGTTTVKGTDQHYEGQPPGAHRRFIPQMALDSFRRGRYDGSIKHARWYYYELFDKPESAGGSRFEKYFGLFDANGNPKAGAEGLRDLIAVCKDSGPRPALTRHNVTVDGNASTRYALLKRSDGKLIMFYWQSSRVFDGVNEVDESVTIKIAGRSVVSSTQPKYIYL